MSTPSIRPGRESVVIGARSGKIKKSSAPKATGICLTMAFQLPTSRTFETTRRPEAHPPLTKRIERVELHQGAGEQSGIDVKNVSYSANISESESTMLTGGPE